MGVLDVGVVGCGTAGSAAAIFLARAGHRVTIYERVPAPEAVGAGITIQPTGLYVLSRLGLEAEVVARGARIDSLVCETSKRKAIVDLAYRDVGEGLFGLGTHRGVLFDALVAAVKKENVPIATGIEIARLEHNGRSSVLIDVEGRRHGPHDLVVVADGARSRVRSGSGAHADVRPYPWGAMWFVAKDTRRDSGHASRIRQVAHGNRMFLGLLPTGLGPKRKGEAEASLVSVFWSLRANDREAFHRGGIEAFRKIALELAPEAEPLIDQIGETKQMLYAGYHDVVMRRWASRTTVYVGDAAHATSPQLGQGSNLALWDAMVLADCVNEANDVGVALDRYDRTRRDHLAYYQFATRWLTPFFQGDATILGALRDIAMPLLFRWGPTRRAMTLSMLGVVDGFFGRTLAAALVPR